MVRAVVYTERATIRFDNCHVQQKFLTYRSDPAVEFRIDDLRSVREAQQSLWIKTPDGVVRVFSSWKNYKAFRKTLMTLAPESSDPWYTHPKLIFVYATLIVLILVLLLFRFA